MSKSYGNTIALSMTPDETVAVIRQTRTDQDRRIGFDPEDRPGVSALLSTAALCRGVEPAELADEIGDGGRSVRKAMTATAVNDFLEPLHVGRQAFAKDEDLVRAILRHGNEAANTSAGVNTGPGARSNGGRSTRTSVRPGRMSRRVWARR